MISPPETTGFGAALCVTERSAAETVTATLEVLFAGTGSVVVEIMFALLERLPFGAAPVTVTTIVNVVSFPMPVPMLVVRVHVTVPAVPTVGFTQFQVPAPVLASDTKVVFAGVFMVNTGVAALFGPLLITTTM